MRGSHVPDSMNEQFTGSTSVHRPESAEMGDEVKYKCISIGLG